MQQDPELCKKFLEGLDYEKDGYCKISKLVPTKEGGYAQVSYGGANKFATLEEVVLWAAGGTKGIGQQCSHRCHKTLCKEVGHVCSESIQKNNERKGCLVWIDCPHCDQKILVCVHEPKCIKFAPGFGSWEDFLENGTHKK